jgi:hypothetical protein
MDGGHGKVACAFCNEEFTPNRRWQKYCKVKCRVYAWQRRMSDKEQLALLKRKVEAREAQDQAAALVASEAVAELRRRIEALEVAMFKK